MAKNNKLTKQITFSIIAVALLIAGAYFIFFQDTLYDDYTLYVENNEAYNIEAHGVQCHSLAYGRQSSAMSNYPCDFCGDAPWNGVCGVPNREPCKSGVAPTNLWNFTFSQALPMGSDGSNAHPVTLKGNEQSFTIKGASGSHCGSSYGSWGASVISNEDFDNKYIKMQITGSRASVYVGKTLVFTQDSETGVLEIIPDITNPDYLHILWKGLEISQHTVVGKKHIKISTPVNSVTITNFRTKHLFSCEVENDEIVVRDSFSEGSTFDIHDLSFAPVKFCVDQYPATIRDLSKQAVAGDIHGEITRNIATGKSLTVEENQVVTFSYIADYTTDMKERCDIAEVYDTKTRTCGGFIQEANDTVVLLRDVVTLDISPQERLFSGEAGVRNDVQDPELCEEWLGQSLNLLIGDKTLTASVPTFTCVTDDNGEPVSTHQSSGSPRPDCWQGSLTYDGKSYTTSYGETTSISSCLDVTYVPVAQWDAGDDMRCLNHKQTQVKIVLSVDTTKCLRVGALDNEYYALFGQDTTADYKIYNEFGTNFPASNAGVNIKETHDLMFSQEVSTQQSVISDGTNDESLDIDTSEYGQVIYQISPYIIIGGETFTSPHQTIYNFDVVDTVPDYTVFCVTDECNEIHDNIIDGLDKSTTNELSAWWIIGAVLLAFLIFVGVVYLIRKKK